jgi:branched-chain amino acid aminotransferase
MFYNYNGVIQQGQGLPVDLNNRALNYGDGIFESMRYANGRINFWEDHYFRLMASMRIVRMEIPLSYSPEYLEEQIRLTLKANELSGQPARIKFLAYRKSGGLYTPQTNDVEYIITTYPLEGSKFELNENGLVVDVFKDFYKQKSLLSNIKSTSAQLYVVASIYKKENKLDECIILNDDRAVCEAISANVFIVKGEEVYTPPLSDGCLKGVMRKNVITSLKKLGFSVHEKSFSPFEIQKADEMFVTNATLGVRWVSSFKKKQFVNTTAQRLVPELNIAAALSK